MAERAKTERCEHGRDNCLRCVGGLCAEVRRLKAENKELAAQVKAFGDATLRRMGLSRTPPPTKRKTKRSKP